MGTGTAARLPLRTCPRCKKTFDSDASFCPSDGAALEPFKKESATSDSDFPAPPDSDKYIGTVLHGDIEIKSVAGAGAMGRVYRAHQAGIDRDVAVKILHRELSGNLPLVQRFHREAKIASKLQHPHVVEVYLAGQLPDGALYIVMEYLDGMSLAAATQASAGMMTLERALPIALQICDAVGEGHARGIVHRDLKPENVMLVRRADTSDWVKVLDFGIAKVSLGEQSMETAAGLIFGTARYISPEGAQGATVRPPGDVYSIATILYQLLAGRTPFDAEQPVGMLIKHIHDLPPTLRSWPAAASVPEQIERVIMDNLVKDPTRRAPSARALGNALASAAKEANVSFSDVGVVARMSMLDLQPSKRPAGLDRTLDDLAAHPPIVIPSGAPGAPGGSSLSPVPLPLSLPHPTSRSPVVPVPPISTDALADTTADKAVPQQISNHPSAPPIQEKKAPESKPGSAKRSGATFIVALAFLLGVAVTAAVMQYLSHRPDTEHVAHLEKTRKAMTNGQYVDPPGDNVRELVTVGIKRWPEDSEFARIQSDAAHEVVTRAMAARSGGDVAGARDLAKTAHELDPTDGSAKLLLAQYEDELANENKAVVRVELEVPIGRARPGGRAELVAKITSATGTDATGAQFIVSGPGIPGDGMTIVAIPAANNQYKATFSPPREGNYGVQFEANVGGATVRADRTLSVTK